MIIKTSDERARDMAVLDGFLMRPDLTEVQRKKVEREQVRLRSGLKGEREATFHIDSHYGNSKNYAVIHDLRLEHNGQVAQIDHLVIGRFLEFFVCETKYWSRGVSINKYGEFTAIYGDKRIGVPSPIAQNERHIRVLKGLIDAGKILRPTRFGVKMPIGLTPVTLVSTGAVIGRTCDKAFSQVIKADQFYQHTQAHFDTRTKVRCIGKYISEAAMRKLAQSIADLHKPITMNYAAKFGIVPHDITRVKPVTKRYKCAKCGNRVEPKVVNYCWTHKTRFDNKVLCRAHQPPAVAILAAQT